MNLHYRYYYPILALRSVVDKYLGLCTVFIICERMSHGIVTPSLSTRISGTICASNRLPSSGNSQRLCLTPLLAILRTLQ